jgi:hypothetical protein
MADTSSEQLHGGVPGAPAAPVEGDGVSYRGIFWFMVILAITTFICQGLMWGFLKLENKRAATNDAPRPALAEQVRTPELSKGRIETGTTSPAPTLLVDEPENLKLYREMEEKTLTTYDWSDRNAGTVRIPLARAKALLIERGLLPVRGAAAESAPVKKGKD